jgi:hypothetical protein
MHLCGAMLGQEAAAQFARYATDALKDVTAEEVLADWSSAKARVENGSTDEVHVRYIDVACKLENYIAKKVLTDAEARNYAGFFNDAPAEVSMKLWTALITGKSSSTTDGVSMPNMMKVKPLVSKKIFNVTNSGKNVAKG